MSDADAGVAYAYGATAVGRLTAGTVNDGSIIAIANAEQGTANAFGNVIDADYGSATLENAGIIRAQAAEPEATAADAISAATRQVAETLDLASIVTYTSSGSTAIRAARERPSKPILALSPNHRTVRRLSVVWGVHCVFSPDAVDLDDMVDRACVIAFKEGLARPGDRIAITAGIPLGTPGATNMLRIAFVRQDGSGSS